MSRYAGMNPPARPGTDDALKVPSLQNGKRVARKPPTAMTSSVQSFAFDDALRTPSTHRKPKKAPKK